MSRSLYHQAIRRQNSRLDATLSASQRSPKVAWGHINFVADSSSSALLRLVGSMQFFNARIGT